MNFYEHARDQRVFNKFDHVDYTAGYLCFMTTPGSGTETETETDSWQESYLCADHIDCRLVNKLKDEELCSKKRRLPPSVSRSTIHCIRNP